MWQLVFASRHRLIIKNNNKKMPKKCLMVMADPSDLRHGKKITSPLPAQYADSVDENGGLLNNRVCTVKFLVVKSYF